MRILIHDYAGHPFQVQLSRALARRGHQVLHLYSASNPTPKGAVAPRAEDPPGFAVEGLRIASAYERYSYIRRWRHERDYGRRLAARVAAWAPDIAILANTPLDSVAPVQALCRKRGIGFVLWIQDLLGIATQRILANAIPVAGRFIGAWYVAMERRFARRSDHVVLITEDFRPILDGWGVPAEHMTVIENWAPLDDFRPAPRDNAWAREHGIAACPAIVYTGMMGLKHNPALVRDLAAHLTRRGDARLVVVSEGRGADWLRERKAAEGLDALDLLPFQPFDRMAEVMASADALLAVLEPDAGIFSVPSKVLSYLCAGRAILLAAPAENLAARIVARHEAGLAVSPSDPAALIAAADRLLDDPEERARLGRNAREYAMTAFEIEGIADRFETVIEDASAGAGRGTGLAPESPRP
jgi:colanic acid biosynthesis glycosyl transferase WcaI